MARVHKTATKKLLAYSPIMRSARYPMGQSGQDAFRIALSVEAPSTVLGKQRSVTLDMDRAEAIGVACFIARHVNRRVVDGVDPRRPWTALRDLADLLES